MHENHKSRLRFKTFITELNVIPGNAAAVVHRHTDSRERQENGSSAVPSSNSIDEMYRSSFTQRLRDSIVKAKGGETNPAFDPNNPNDRKHAAFSLRQSIGSDRHEYKQASNAVDIDRPDSYIESKPGEHNPGREARLAVLYHVLLHRKDIKDKVPENEEAKNETV